MDFFTDAGAGYFLSKLRNNLGNFLSLTGTWLKGAELVQVGLTDFYVPSERLKFIEQDIIRYTDNNTTIEEFRAIIQRYAQSVEAEYKGEEFINNVFGKDSVEEIYQSLRESKENKEFADSLIKIMDSHSPLSLKIIFEQMRRGKHLDLKEDLKMERRLVYR